MSQDKYMYVSFSWCRTRFKCSSILLDNLFGTCQDILKEPYIIQFRATETMRGILEFSLKGLLDLGYGWRDEYTQCIIGGLLQSYELDVTPEVTYCDRAERERLQRDRPGLVIMCGGKFLTLCPENMLNGLWVNLTTGLYNIHGKLFLLVKIGLIIKNMNTVEFETAR